jgi:hypothetical protein
MAEQHQPDKPPTTNPGPGVDAYGQPVIDPTQNVLDLVKAAMQRQDDLREMQSQYTGRIGEMREVHARDVSELRAAYDGQLREAARRSEERLDSKDQQLRAAETARIDAIRAVDVGAVNRAAEVSATQAATLATQVATSAEALRGQVEAARQQTATALAAALEPIQKDIQDLRRAQYEAQGQKTQVVETRDTRSEQRLNNGQLLTIVSVILVAAGIIVTILLATGH